MVDDVVVSCSFLLLVGLLVGWLVGLHQFIAKTTLAKERSNNEIMSSIQHITELEFHLSMFPIQRV